jgi:thiol-disulfide isomerase/thioredoxin
MVHKPKTFTFMPAPRLKLPKLTAIKRPKAACSQPAPRWMTILAFSLVALLAAALIFQFLLRPASGAVARPIGMAERFDELKPKTPDTEFVFLYMDGCGWCDRFKPTWKEFVATYERALRDKGVRLLAFESKDPNAETYKPVKGYPTLLLVKKDTVVFEGDRTVAGLTAFLNANGIRVGVETFVDRLANGMQGTMDGVKTAIEDGNRATDDVQKSAEHKAGMRMKRG